jgi:excisionase family DNA binding protein
MSEKIYRISEAAQELKVSRQTIYDWIKSGRLSKLDIGGITFIPQAAIIQAMKEKK